MFFLYFCGFAGGAYLMEHENYSFKDVMQAKAMERCSRLGE